MGKKLVFVSGEKGGTASISYGNEVIADGLDKLPEEERNEKIKEALKRLDDRIRKEKSRW